MNRSQRLPRGYLVSPAFQSRHDNVRSRWIVKEQPEDQRTGVSSTSEAIISFGSKETVTSNSGSRLMGSNELVSVPESQTKSSIRSSGYGRDYKSSLSECSSISPCSSTTKMGGGYHASSNRSFVDSRSRWRCDVLATLEGSCHMHQLDISPLKEGKTFSGGKMYPNYEKVKDTRDYRLQNHNLKSRWNEEGSGSRFDARTRTWRSGFSYDQRSNTPLKLEKQRRMSWNRSSHILPDVDPYQLSCPICMEMLDETDSSFSSCSCGFKLCLFCHHTIATEDGRCPGCRKSYDQNEAPVPNIGESYEASQRKATHTCTDPAGNPTQAL